MLKLNVFGVIALQNYKNLTSVNFYGFKSILKKFGRRKL